MKYIYIYILEEIINHIELFSFSSYLIIYFSNIFIYKYTNPNINKNSPQRTCPKTPHTTIIFKRKPADAEQKHVTCHVLRTHERA